jgi:ADP-ribose pyrophosphatase YjhB (NUDIX family)
MFALCHGGLILQTCVSESTSSNMNFCSECGAQVSLQLPPGDNRLRHICSVCGTIHYHNPKMVVGCIPEWHDKILLCRRAIEPRYGLWTLPGGFMENGETVDEGAIRETLEEAGAHVDQLELHTMISLPDINQVYLMFRARLCDLDFHPGEESLEVALFSEAEIPWQEIAFRTIHNTLETYFADRRLGHFQLHLGNIFHKPRSP